jgi:nitrogen fixation/metabolism regulation signal transduction histidine kinase
VGIKNTSITLIAILSQTLLTILGVILTFLLTITSIVSKNINLIFLFSGFEVTISILGLVWVILDFILILNNLQNDLEKAKKASLILGLLQFIFGGIIPGIIILILYLRLHKTHESNLIQIKF